MRLGTRNTAGYNLAGFTNVLLEHIDVFVIDLGNAFCGKAAKLSASEMT